MKPFERVPPTVDFPAQERAVLELWDRLDAFRTSVEMRDPETEFTFYDGPPFPTGSPHYGNLLAGVLKDIVPRYWTMRGHRVERRFGWDTHGLPIEMEVQKELGLSGPADIERYGVARFNEACRSRVMANTEVWEAITRRIGRWVDFEDDYSTMDLDFMESVWWVFKQLWDRGYVYRDFKVLPYSFGAATPLSNFEVNLGAYRDVEDPSITVRLEVTDGAGPARAGDHLLVWTTTPWTMPSNLGVAVGPGIRYVRVDRALGGLEGRYWLAAERVAAYWPDEEVVPAAEAAGTDLIGTRYRPVFDHFADRAGDGAFVVIASDETTTEEGTGLVHMAPAYGEADFAAFAEAGLDVLVDPVDSEGRFTEAVPEVAGVNVKEADSTLLRLMEERGALVQSGRIVHSYPYCWRTDTPLIYKAIPTWFVAVERFRDRMAELNRQIHWVPEAIGSRRFGNWLAQARDWAISRNRYWGSCIPVWECEGCGEQVCIGSVDDLAERSGTRLDDLHKHFVDEVSFPCHECGRTMHRVPEVLDVWFESGAMPYGQHHYPFEDAEAFERKFPADYIAEGLDQTRGWFYTLVAHAAAIFDSVPFKNCVVNGMILAEDGRKMSKSLNNYPDPREMFDTHGADAMRWYLLSSSILRGGDGMVTEEGMRDTVRHVLLPLWNSWYFLTLYANAAGHQGVERTDSSNVLDRYVLSKTRELVVDMTDTLDQFDLFGACQVVRNYLDVLTNWYVRRSRDRFWAGDHEAIDTLHTVLSILTRVSAPLLPLVAEEIHSGLHGTDHASSVHLTTWPDPDDLPADADLVDTMDLVRDVCSATLSVRKAHQRRVRLPLNSVTIAADDAGRLEDFVDVIADEVNVRHVELTDDVASVATERLQLVPAKLGPRLGKDVQQVIRAHKAGDWTVDGDRVIVGGVVLEPGEYSLDLVASDDRASAQLGGHAGVIALDVDVTEELEIEGRARDLVRLVQQARRDAGLDVSDRIELTVTATEPWIGAVEAHEQLIAGETLAVSVRAERTDADGDSEPVITVIASGSAT